MTTLPDNYPSFPFAAPPTPDESIDHPPQVNDFSDESSSPASEDDAAALRDLKEELSNIPHGEKSSLIYVQRVNPDLVDDKHVLMFLQADNFDVSLALARLLRYWRNRHKVFGPARFALPMTLDGAMKDRTHALKQGFLILLPVLDPSGRAIMYSNSSPYKQSNPPAEQKIQVWWYLLHVAMESPSALKKGFVILANSRDSSLNNFDSKWALAACSSGDRDFPIRWKMAHVCHANAVFPFVASAVKALLSPKQRKSFVLHNGSNERVIESLSKYMLPKHCIPTDLGGDLRVSTEDFVRERLAIEGSGFDEIIAEKISSSAHQGEGTIWVDKSQPDTKHNRDYASSDQAIYSQMTHSNNFPPKQEGSSKHPFQDTMCVQHVGPDANNGASYSKPVAASNVSSQSFVHGELPQVTQSNNFPGLPIPNQNDMSSAMENTTANAPVQDILNQQKRRRSKSDTSDKLETTRVTNKAGRGEPPIIDVAQNVKVFTGRFGDPRMNRAVEAKMISPHLTLVEALVAGGFIFPGIDSPGIKIGDVKDTDSVTVYQRRNQLMRRLRFLKKGKAKETKSK